MNTMTKLLAAGATTAVILTGGGVAVATSATSATSTTSTTSTTAITAATTAGAAAAPKVTAERAIAIAHRRVSGAWVREVSFERHAGRADVWKVELVQGSAQREVRVSAGTGAVSGPAATVDDHRRNDDHGADDHGGHGGDDH
jgi:uncharacterized membrane protein YkoI